VYYLQSKILKRLASTQEKTTSDGQYVALIDKKTGPRWVGTKALLK
jgi:hypothetical protein